MTRDLVPVHGGLEELVDRTVPLSVRKELVAEAAELPSVRVTRADQAMLHRIGDGALSPLEGPMGAEAWNRVLDERVIVSRGKRYAWTIPLALPISDAEAANALRAGGVGRGAGRGGRPRRRSWTASRSSPGTRRATSSASTARRASTIRAAAWSSRIRGRSCSAASCACCRAVLHPEYGEYLLTPRMTRALIRDRKWQRALAFQTRNPLHRAHEYALVAGAERLTGEGQFTGVVLNPLVGELKGDDVPAAMRMRCYRELHDKQLLGQGDKDEAIWKRVGYDLPEVFELIGLDIKMFYGGPSEAVMHGIYRQNYGFSDLVIGRKHADAPYEDGKPIWGDFDAQDIFDALPGELHIKPCKIGFAAFYESLGRVDLDERHPNEKPYSISGTKVREQLRAGERPDPRIMRPEIADILIEAYRRV